MPAPGRTRTTEQGALDALAEDEWYWWGWGERLAPAGDVQRATEMIARVLRDALPV